MILQKIILSALVYTGVATMLNTKAQVNEPTSKPVTKENSLKVYKGGSRNGFYTAKCELEKEYVMLECMDTSKNMLLSYCGPIERITDSTFNMLLDYAYGITVINISQYFSNQYDIADPGEKKRIQRLPDGMISDSISFSFIKELRLIGKQKDTTTITQIHPIKSTTNFIIDYAVDSAMISPNTKQIQLKLRLGERIITSPPIKFQYGEFNHNLYVINGNIQPQGARFIVQFKQSKGKLIITHPGLFAHLQTFELMEANK